MTVRGTLVLAAVLATLLAYLVVTRPPSGPSRGRTMLTPPLGAATAVEILRGAEATRFIRRDGTWSPPGGADLVDALASLEVLDVVEDTPSDPSTYGLGADALRLRVTSDDGELVALEVGATNPAETAVYVRRIGSAPVLLVGALLRWELEKIRRVASTTSPP
jgi:hypothetical protein